MIYLEHQIIESWKKYLKEVPTDSKKSVPVSSSMHKYYIFYVFLEWRRNSIDR